MQADPTNPCIRCGKPRITTKTWREGNITYSTTECPDRVCQEIVERELKKQKDRLVALQEASLKRRMENRTKKKDLS